MDEHQGNPDDKDSYAAVTKEAATSPTVPSFSPFPEEEETIPPEPLVLHQPRSLTDACLHFLARHLDVLADRRHRNRAFPSQLFVRLLHQCKSHEWVNAADPMLQIMRNLPSVDTPEVDELYWKAVCELTLSLNIPITFPYPALVAHVRKLKAALETWMATAAAADKRDAAATPAAAHRLLRALGGLPMSVQLLEDAAGLGETLSQLSKSEPSKGVPEDVREAAGKLRRTWKGLVKQQRLHEENLEKYDDYTGAEEDPMAPLNIGLRALMVRSWQDVYVFSLEYGEYRRGKIGKRALVLAEAHEAKKRRTVVVQERLGDAADIEAELRKGKPPPGNTKMVARLVGYRPPVKPKGKSFGGLQFVSPKKKKHLVNVFKPSPGGAK